MLRVLLDGHVVVVVALPEPGQGGAERVAGLAHHVPGIGQRQNYPTLTERYREAVCKTSGY